MPKIVMELIFELSTPNRSSTRSISEWIPGLNHELWNDTMENDTLEVATPRMSHEVLYSFRCLLRKQAHVYIAHSCVYGGGVGKRRRPSFAHWCSGRRRLFLSSWFFIEHVSIAALVISA